jgi:hypothetical protein
LPLISQKSEGYFDDLGVCANVPVTINTKKEKALKVLRIHDIFQRPKIKFCLVGLKLLHNS